MNQPSDWTHACRQGVTQLGLVLVLLLASDQSYAKNVIFFLGDGMGISTVTAARIYAGQAGGATGEAQSGLRRVSHLALIKTATDAQVPDSAAASALVTGEKASVGVLGVNDSVARDDCAAALQNTRWRAAERAGMGTGIVSTARITHTPAAPTLTRPTVLGKAVRRPLMMPRRWAVGTSPAS